MADLFEQLPVVLAFALGVVLYDLGRDWMDRDQRRLETHLRIRISRRTPSAASSRRADAQAHGTPIEY